MGTFSVILVGIVCFVLGAIAGGVLLKLYSSDRQRIEELEKLVQNKQDELKSYQLDVSQHFTEAANFLSQLSSSYREMHNHLASGAKKLCNSSPTQPLIIEPLADPNSPDSPLESSSTLSPPLDYAPKQTPFERGALDEGYGLEKVALEEQSRQGYR